MTAGYGEKKKSPMPKSLRILLIILAVLIAFAVIGVFSYKNSRSAADNVKAETVKQQEQASKAEFKEPVLTVCDTDSKRRYGYDVLYSHKNLRILLTESHIYTDSPELKFEIVNDSKRDYTVELAYCSLDNMWFDMSFSAEAASGTTAAASAKTEDSRLKGSKIKSIRLCFLITDHKDGSMSYSEPVIVRYELSGKEPSWSVSASTTTRLETDEFTLMSGSFDNEIVGGTGVMKKDMYIDNASNFDLKYSIENIIVIDADGNEIPSEDYTVDYEGIVPGYALYDRMLTLTLSKDPERISRIKRVGFDLVVTRLNDPSSLGYTTYRVGFSHELE